MVISEKFMPVVSEKPRLDLLAQAQGVYSKQPREVEEVIEETPSMHCVCKLLRQGTASDCELRLLLGFEHSKGLGGSRIGGAGKWLLNR